MSGNILLQVEQNGEGWYVYPDDKKKYYLGRPADAFSIMRNLGLGIKHSELIGYLNSKFPSRLSGKIVLDVEKNGEAYYINPKNLKGYFLSRPADAFKVMRELGLGITNTDIRKIDVGEVK
jgi:ribosomal protein L30/L7E